MDSGIIHWFLQEGKIQSIHTKEQEYRPNDNALLFSVKSGMANQYILDLKKNVWRGVESRLMKGWAYSLPPHGYLNDQETKTIAC